MEFTKMQGTGNDYMYVDCFKETAREPAKIAIYASDRHFSVGSDGLILMCPSRTADYRVEMYNTGGSQGIICGNGMHCVGKYAYDHGLVDKDKGTITVETLAEIKTLELETEGGRAVSITVGVGGAALTSRPPEDIMMNGEQYRLVGINMGNPHATYYVGQVDSLDLERIRPTFRNHAQFAPDHVNTEFTHVMNRKRLDVQVRERESGEIRACGTGATASAMASIPMGCTKDEVGVVLRGGRLIIRYDKESGHLSMTGPAVEVPRGSIDVPEEIYYD